ncbi:MAG: RidA family protein [Bryobacteraceae bacterium]|nr:RidA family protein [Bryobacteraceae bacterium]MDW8380313.1 RidA family protein [Bryobacterales bacterium]
MQKTRAVVLIALLSASFGLAVEKKVISPPGPPGPARPFSPALLVGDTLYVSGMVGRDASGKRPENFEDEVKATLDAIGEILKAAGASFADAVSVQVYLTDMSLFDRMNQVYMPYFPEPRPTRTTVGVAKLVGDYRIEITLTARVERGKKAKKK